MAVPDHAEHGSERSVFLTHLRALQALTSLLIHVLYICHGGERLAYKARYGITVDPWSSLLCSV